MEKIPFNRKLVDVGNTKPYGKVELHWISEIISNVFGKTRASKERKNKDFKFYDPEYLLKTFNISGFEFGNWLSQEDRYIYMAGCGYAMKDFCDIHGMPYSKFGFNDLSISFGARGRAGSLAHFEPRTNVINLTRHRTYEKSGARIPKSIWDDGEKYLGKNGAGSLGHEYGHAIDFAVGVKAKNLPFNFASESISLIKYNHKDEKENLIYKLKDDFVIDASVKPYFEVMKALIYDNAGEKETYKLTQWYEKLKQEIEESPLLGQYWIRDIEVFARSFEVYLSMKCEEKGVSESFLKKNKYQSFLYPPKDFMKKSGAYDLFNTLVGKFFSVKGSKKTWQEKIDKQFDKITIKNANKLIDFDTKYKSNDDLKDAIELIGLNPIDNHIYSYLEEYNYHSLVKRLKGLKKI